MFVLRSLGRLILGDREQRELLELTNLKLYKVQKTSQPFADGVTLTLIRQDDDNDDGSLNENGEALYGLELEGLQKNQKPFKYLFPINLQLGLTVSMGEDYSRLVWSDLGRGHQWEALCAHPETPKATVEMFCLTLAQCLFEEVEGKSLEEATDQDMEHWMAQIKPTDSKRTEKNSEDKASEKKSMETGEENASGGKSAERAAKPAATLDLGRIEFECSEVHFYQYDPASNLFQPLRESPVTALLHHTPQEQYCLSVLHQGTLIHQQTIDPDATTHCDRPTSSFIWCWLNPANSQLTTLSLRFVSSLDLLAWSNAMGRVIYECLNELSMAKLSLEDASYLMAPFMMEGIEPTADIHGDDGSEASEDGEDGEASDESDSGDDSSHDEQASNRTPSKHSHQQNEQLTVGYKEDRSFVVRGSEIGIFNHPGEGLLEQTAAVTAEWKSRVFNPSRILLHDQDSSLLLLDREREDRIYRMDLERGQVVEEWQAKEGMAVTQLVPEQKYAQLTGNQGLVGLNANSVFRLDARLPTQAKLVDSQSKQYAVKHDFTAASTTGQGEVAVASAKGEIRLFNKLGIRAKSLLPGFGDPILAIDVTESGRLLVATCKTYLLLIETQQGSESAFSKSLTANLPPPKRLQLRPEHIAHMGTPPSFTPARFSTGGSEERSIITSTGPYVITWNLRRVKQGHLYDYQMRRYEDRVVADSFRFGQDRSIVVTLPHQVTMISKRSLASPLRELNKKK